MTLAGPSHEYILRHLIDRRCLRTPPVIAQQIGCDFEKIPPSGHFAVLWMRGAEESNKAFLRQVIGERTVSAHACKVCPERAGRSRIECGELLVIHRHGGR